MDRTSAEDLLREGRFHHARDPLAALLAAASAPAPADREAPGEAAALAAFRAARTTPTPPRGHGSLRDTLARLLTAKVAAFGLIAAAGVGGVALVTVSSPLQTSDRGSRPAAASARAQSSTAQVPPPAAPAPPVSAVPPSAAQSTGQSAGSGRDRGTPSSGQLCRELTGMDDRRRDSALRDARYRDLIRDAGGTDRVGPFCADERHRRDDRQSSVSAPQPGDGGSGPRDGGTDPRDDHAGPRDDDAGSPDDGSGSHDGGSGSPDGGSGPRHDGSGSHEGGGSPDNGSGSHQDGSGPGDDSVGFRDGNRLRDDHSSRDSGSPRDSGKDGYPGGRPSTPPSVSSAPKPPPPG